ncbi:MAG TPA: cobalamin-independent methionine synthase II family protein [Acidimicrobiales bacterium]
MSASTRSAIRAESLGSLLQSERLLDARARHRSGALDAAGLSEIEDAEVLEAIKLQESLGFQIVTDGELRRPGWSNARTYLDGLEPRKGPRSYPTNVNAAAQSDPEAAFPTVVRRVSPRADAALAEEYPFLKSHARSRTKYTMAAPSYFRRFWSDTASTDAYENCEVYLNDVATWMRSVARWLADQGCDYIQLDAPNYGSLCDPANRVFHTEQGHDLDAELVFDAKLDSSICEGLDVTAALHICRGNGPGGRPHSAGSYEAIAELMFPNLEFDVALLEYDSDRSGDLDPIRHVKPGTIAVLGLLTTKDGALESRAELEGRIKEAAELKPLDELALSTQCGFASAANAPMTLEEQDAKLAQVIAVSRAVWGGV